MTRRISTSVAFALCLLVSSAAFATNGYFTHGIGTKNKGMAGAGLASPEGSIFIANNPAAALFAEGELDVGAGVFNPNRDYSSSASLANGMGGAFTIGPNDLSSESNWFVLPFVAYSWRIDDASALGLAFYGRGGMNTDWHGGTATFDPDGPGPAPVMSLPGTFGGGEAGVDLMQAFLDVAYARKITDSLTLGVSGIAAIQAFSAQGLASFAPFTRTFAASGGTLLPTRLSDNGHSYSEGYGYKVGLQWQLSAGVAVAAAYQSNIEMSKFSDYSDLFAENGEFDIPSNLKLGLTFQATDRVAISTDVEQTLYSNVNSVGNPGANIFMCPTVNPMSTNVDYCLGGAHGAGFGWDDVTTYKLGVEWKTSDDMTWRAGYSHGEQPIKSSEVLFNILAPAVIEDHITFGFTRTLPRKSKLTLSFMYALKGEQSGPNPFDPTQTINLQMNQFELEVGYAWTLK